MEDTEKKARFERALERELRRRFVISDNGALSFEQVSNVKMLWGQQEDGSNVLFATTVDHSKRREEFRREPRTVQLDLGCSQSCKVAIFAEVGEDELNHTPSWYHYYRIAPPQPVKRLLVLYNEHCCPDGIKGAVQSAVEIQESIHLTRLERHLQRITESTAVQLQPAFA